MTTKSRCAITRGVTILLLTVALAGRAWGVSDDAATAEGHWEGAIEIPGMELGIIVELARTDGGWSGTIDIPLQGAKGLPLEVTAGEGAGIRFDIQGVPGAPTFDGVLKGGKLLGTFSQGGQQFPFSLGREKGRALPQRPQEPEPPYPYDAEEVSYSNAGITLEGTLTLPPGAGPFPGVVLISGSGPQNRDEEIFGHKPFLVLADALTRSGIAVLRADDRGVGGSTGDLAAATTEDLAGDALAAVSLLLDHPRVDERRIGLLGHSEGGIVAPLAASRAPRVAFLVLLAPTAIPGHEVVEGQIRTLMMQTGASDSEIEAQLRRQRRAVELLSGQHPEPEAREELGAMIRAQLEAAGHPTEGLEEVVERQVENALSPWARFFLRYDPRPVLAGIRIPVLALFGELDVQVAPEQNERELREALEKAGNGDVTVTVLPGLNHLFQEASTGSIAEYATIAETMSPRVLDLVQDWILARFGPREEEPTGPSTARMVWNREPALMLGFAW